MKKLIALFAVIAVILSACSLGGGDVQALEDKLSDAENSADVVRAIADFTETSSDGLLAVPKAEVVSYGLIGEQQQERFGVHYSLFVVEDPANVASADKEEVRGLVGEMLEATTEHVLRDDPEVVDVRVQVVSSDIEFRQSDAAALYTATRDNLLELSPESSAEAWLDVAEKTEMFLLTDDNVRIIYDDDVTQAQRQTIDFSLERVQIMFENAGVRPNGTMYAVTSSDSFVEKYISVLQKLEGRDIPENSFEYLKLREHAQDRGDSVRGVAFSDKNIVILNVHKIQSDLYELAHVTIHEWGHVLQNELVGDPYIRGVLPSSFVEITADMLSHHAVTYAVCDTLAAARTNDMPLVSQPCTPEEADAKLLQYYLDTSRIFSTHAQLLELGDGISSVSRFFEEFGNYTQEFLDGRSVEDIPESELIEFSNTAFNEVFERVFGVHPSELN